MSNHEGGTSNRLPSEGGSSSLGGWGGSSSGELDSWSWDEEEDLDSEPALPGRRRSEDGLGRTARHPQLDGDYVELLEPRVGPDGGVDTKQRYLEMHGICKTKTLPLCRRGKAIKLRKGRAWGYGRVEGSGSFRGAKRDVVTPRGDVVPHRPPPAVPESGKGSRSYSSSVHDSDEGDKTSRDSEGLESHRPYFDSLFKERRPGVGKERDSNSLTQTRRDDNHHRGKDSESADSSAHDSTNLKVIEGHSDPGSHSDSVFEDADKPPSGDSDATTPTLDAPERPFNGVLEPGENTNVGSKMKSSADEERDDGKTEDRVGPSGKEVKTTGFRAARYRLIYSNVRISHTVVHTLRTGRPNVHTHRPGLKPMVQKKVLKRTTCPNKHLS